MKKVLICVVSLAVAFSVSNTSIAASRDANGTEGGASLENDMLFPPSPTTTVHIQPVGTPRIISGDGEKTIDVEDAGTISVKFKDGKAISFRNKKTGQNYKLVPDKAKKKVSRGSSY